MQKFTTYGAAYDKELYDALFFNHLNLNEITNNDTIIDAFTKDIDALLNKKEGFALFTVDVKKKSHVILLVVTLLHGSSRTSGYITTEDKDIDVGTTYKLEQTKDISLWRTIKDSVNAYRRITENDVVDMLLQKTLIGYRVNTSKLDSTLQLLEAYNDITEVTVERNYTNTNDLMFNYNDMYTTSFKNVKNIVDKAEERYDFKLEGSVFCNSIRPIPNSQQSGYYYNDATFTVAHIDSVMKIGNIRFAMYTTTTALTDKSYKISKFVIKYSPTMSSSDSATIKYKTKSFLINGISGINHMSSILERIPYNYIDKDRTIVAYGDSRRYHHVVVSEDPMINEYDLDEIINSSLKYLMLENITLDSLRLYTNEAKTNSLDVASYLSTGSYNTFANKKTLMKALKSLNDEYKYLYKKVKADGEDIKITDSILYTHDTGQIEYNDFAFAIDDERVKDILGRNAKNSVISYYRKEKTEEEVINLLTEVMYAKLADIISYVSEKITINITFNKTVKVKLEFYRNESSMTYINDCRINKNEIINLLREVSCYTSQASADKFIRNITKRGLSVFIGLSSGFFLDKKFFKFKTTDKNGIYNMNIDGVDIKIKGKKVFNTLYNICILNNRTTSRGVSNVEFVNNHIYKNAISKFDYIKYKIMIDKSYQLFIDKSRGFLDKKVSELGAEHVMYYDENQGKNYAGINVTGTSGKTYTIAYDLKESFVFMDSEDDGVAEQYADNEPKRKQYKNGTYICMIDQSKMKASVGFDTVVSKLLSLKNDSVIASTIYNLEDELNK